MNKNAWIWLCLGAGLGTILGYGVEGFCRGILIYSVFGALFGLVPYKIVEYGMYYED